MYGKWHLQSSTAPPGAEWTKQQRRALFQLIRLDNWRKRLQAAHENWRFL